MIDNPMESEYVRRPDAKGHLKVMELLRKWDPIGVITDENQDEYDNYSATIVRLLDAGISEKDLFKHMKRIVEERMGISCDKKHTQQIANELVEFWKEWKTE
jgi:DNA relaxase NicK